VYPANLRTLVASVRRLYEACTILPEREKAVDEAVHRALDRLNLLTLVGECSTVVVTGVQGVGKTALVRSLYNLPPDLLPESGGRDERTPIRIVEHDKPDLEAVAYRTDRHGMITLEPVALDNLKHSTRHDTWTFAYQLSVPRQHFAGTQRAWLLLPGWEQNRPEDEWNLRVTMAAKAADTCLIVTTPTRLAQAAHQSFLESLVDSFGAQPLAIAVTHSDQSTDRNAQAVKTAEALFRLEPGLVVSVDSLVGGDRDWTNPLFQALDKSLAGLPHAKTRLAELETFMADELRGTLDDLERFLSANQASARAQQRSHLEPVLKEFDEENKELRAELRKALQSGMDAHRERAQNSWDNSLVDRSLMDKVRGCFDTLALRQEYKENLTARWDRDAVFRLRKEALIAAGTARYNVRTGKENNRQSLELPTSTGQAAVLDQHKEGSDLEYLSGLDGSQPTDLLLTTVRKLPLMAVLAAVIGLDSFAPSGFALFDSKTGPQKVIERLQKAGGFQTDTLKTFGKMLVIDISADGKLDLPKKIAELFTAASTFAPKTGAASAAAAAGGIGAQAAASGGAATAASSGAATATAAQAAAAAKLATAIVGVGIGLTFLAGFAVHEVCRREFDLSSWGHQTFKDWSDQTSEQILIEYDHGMKQVRERLIDSLEKRHGLHRDFGDRQRLSAAVTDVKRDIKHTRDAIRRHRGSLA